MTPEQDAYLVALTEAAGRRKRAEDTYTEAVAAVQELIVGAHGVGLPPTPIARAAGISRQRVYQTIDKMKGKA